MGVPEILGEDTLEFPYGVIVLPNKVGKVLDIPGDCRARKRRLRYDRVDDSRDAFVATFILRYIVQLYTC